MNSRPDLENKISEKLKILSDADMQKLVEEYVKVRYPERFSRFEFRAVSEAGKTRKGWPDAWVVHDDGRIDGVEATGAMEKSKVKKHILADINNAHAQSQPMAGFVFISGHPKVQFKAEELAKFKQDFIKAGVPSERCELIFGMSFVGELANPKFALLRHMFLGIPICPKIFSPVVPKLAWGQQELLFVPSVNDYEENRVHRPQAVDEVSALLDQTGLVLVRGIGASGKTVLARLLALDMTNRSLPSYYLDFARFDMRLLSGGELARDMDDFGGQGVLFILDNVHLNELSASEFVSHWEHLLPGQRPNLLLLGRELHSGFGSPIDDLKITAIPLRARQPELLGVYRRLAERGNTLSCPLLLPPPEVLDKWVATFGGDPHAPDTTTDLIAFSAAVLTQLVKLKKGHWTLTEEHAVHAIRKHYLDKLSQKETDNMMRLAALSELELVLPQEALADNHAAFKIASCHFGLVFEENGGDHIRYRLAHAALGRLFLKASYTTVDVTREQLAVALAYPFWGFVIVQRFQNIGQVDQAKVILARLMARPECLLELGNCQHLLFVIRLIQKLDAANLASVAAVFSHKGNNGRLVQMVLATQLQFLKDFMIYAKATPALNPLFKAVINALVDMKNQQALAEKALDSPLDKLKSFMSYAETIPALYPVLKTMTNALVDLKNQQTLIKKTLVPPLGQLKDFMLYTETTTALHPVFKAMTNALVDLKNQQALIKKALDSPLDNLNDFLVFAKATKALRSMFDVLVIELRKPENSKLLVDSFIAAPLNQIVAILKDKTATELWGAVLTAVDAAKWQRSRLLDASPSVNAFISFKENVVDRGRPELVTSPALNIVLRASIQDWHKGVGFHQFTEVLCNAKGASPEEINRFLRTIATEDWVEEHIRHGAKTGGLAGALFKLATELHEQQHLHFFRPGLEKRVRYELTAYPLSNYCDWAAVISLLGTATLLGVRIDTMELPCLDTPDLRAIIELRNLQPEDLGIGPLQRQLWLGLRELARLCNGLGSVSVIEAETILERWRESNTGESCQTLSPFISQKNAVMIDWLESCQNNGWRLLAS